MYGLVYWDSIELVKVLIMSKKLCFCCWLIKKAFFPSFNQTRVYCRASQFSLRLMPDASRWRHSWQLLSSTLYHSSKWCTLLDTSQSSTPMNKWVAKKHTWVCWSTPHNKRQTSAVHWGNNKHLSREVTWYLERVRLVFLLLMLECVHI